MWQVLKRAEIPLRVVVMIALAYLGYVFLARHDSRNGWMASLPSPTADASAKFNATYGGTALRIVSFYASSGEILEDQSTNICYSVVNARSVKIDPPMKDIYPALNRCLAVEPERDTKYTLTAEGNDGTAATADFTVKVLPDLANRPKITSFQVEKHSVERGVHYFTISFAFANARTVSIDPEAFSPIEDSAPFGTFIVAPDTTTTYTLTVTGKKGRQAHKQLTVEVPKN